MASKKTTTRKASKKTATRKTSHKRRRLQELRELTAKAQGEVAELLAHAEAGSLTPMELKIELEDLAKQLKEMEIFEHDL